MISSKYDDKLVPQNIPTIQLPPPLLTSGRCSPPPPKAATSQPEEISTQRTSALIENASREIENDKSTTSMGIWTHSCLCKNCNGTPFTTYEEADTYHKTVSSTSSTSSAFRRPVLKRCNAMVGLDVELPPPSKKSHTLSSDICRIFERVNGQRSPSPSPGPKPITEDIFQQKITSLTNILKEKSGTQNVEIMYVFMTNLRNKVESNPSFALAFGRNCMKIFINFCASNSSVVAYFPPILLALFSLDAINFKEFNEMGGHRLLPGIEAALYNSSIDLREGTEMLTALRIACNRLSLVVDQ
jgi:hypothetical protein